MKSYKLFWWALNRIKWKNNEAVKCLRNDILLRIMNLSGIKLADIDEMANIFNSKKDESE